MVQRERARQAKESRDGRKKQIWRKERERIEEKKRDAEVEAICVCKKEQ